MNKLWLKISFRYFLLILFILLGLGFFIANTMKQSYTDMTKQQLSQDAEMVAEFIDQEKLMNRSPAIQTKMESLYTKDHPRITILDTFGTVLADTEENPTEMENHATRPEVAAIIQQHQQESEVTRYSESLGFNMMYVTHPIMRDNKLIGVVRVAYSLKMIDDMIHHLWLILGIVIGLLLILSGVIGMTLAKGITRPIEAIIHVANHLTKRNYASRIPIKTKGEIRQLSNAVNSLAESLEKQMEAIQDREQQLTGVLDNMVSGVMLVDINGKIALVNRAMEDLIGVQSDMMIQKSHEDFGSNIGFSKYINRSLKKGEIIHNEIRTYLPSERILDAHIAPYTGIHAEIKGVIIVFHDITDIRHLENMRSHFVANVSHELKTPITSLKGFAETLLDGAMDNPDVARSFLQIIYDESDRLHRLIQDILHLSKIEQQLLPFQPESLDVMQIIDKTIHMVKDDIQKKQIEMILPTHDHFIIEAEKDRLKQIVLNLIANAITYTPKYGRITIDLAIEKDMAIIKIADTGIGIAKEELSRIFERFYRVDKARSRNSGGTGLGLAIVKHLVESHHGEIHVNSIEGKGTTFMVSLPVKQID